MNAISRPAATTPSQNGVRPHTTERACGVTTNMCVETTARDASQRDYRVFVVSDATGELDRARHDHALFAIGFGFGWVVPTGDVVEAWT